MGLTDSTARIASMHALALRLLTLLVLTAVVGCSSRSVSSETVATVQAALGNGPPYTHVQAASNIAGPVTSLTATFTSAVNAGDLLVATVRAGNAAIKRK